MKKLRYAVALFLVAILILVSCGDKVKPEHINTRDYSRQIEAVSGQGNIRISHTDKSTEMPGPGTTLRSDDSILIGDDSELTISVDGDKQAYLEANADIRLEASGTPASGKTRFCLNSGSILCGVDEPLGTGELFEVQTPNGTVSISGAIVRVSVINGEKTGYTLIEVFEGEGNVVINKTGERAVAKAGEALLIENNEGKPRFVLLDEIDLSFWNSHGIDGIAVGKDGTGSNLLPIPYDILPPPAIDQLLGYAQNGTELAVSQDVLQDLRDTGHSYAEKDVLKEVSCSETGLRTMACIFCGALVEEEIPLLPHTETDDPAVPSTCMEEGLTAGVHCGICGAILVEQQPVPLAEHTEEEDPAVPATCSEDGLTAGTHCSVCGVVLTEQQIVPAIGHLEEIDPAVPPTCTEDGLTIGSHCGDCGVVLTVQEVVPAVGHEEQEDSEAIAPGCLTEGLSARIVCAVCGELLEEPAVIPATGHIPETVPAVAPTCTRTGKTESVACAVCGEVLTAPEDVPIVDHTPVTVAGREPTCVRPGLTEGQRCAVCRTMLVPQKSIPMIDHQPVTVPAKEPTCTKDGYNEHIGCAICGMAMSGLEVIPALDHTLVSIPGREPTCTRPGLTEGQRCTVCRRIVEPQKTIPTLPHTAEVIPAVAPTCTETGLTEGSRCSVCGKTLTEQEVIPMLPHEVEFVPGYEATCAQPGLSDGQRCTVCGQMVVAQEVIPSLPHNPKKIYGIYAMCFRDGYTDGLQCADCGFWIEPSEVIPALSHTPGGLAGEDATCSHVGLTGGLSCQICGAVIVPRNEIPKLPHTPGIIFKQMNPILVVLKADGTMLVDKNHPEYCYANCYNCKVCGELVQDALFGHVPYTQPPFYVHQQDICNQVSTTCAECGQTIRITRNGHNETYVDDPPSADGSFLRTWTCADCSMILRAEIIVP